MKMKPMRRLPWAIGGGVAVVLLAMIYAFFFASLSNRNATAYLEIDTDDTADSVRAKVKALARPLPYAGFRAAATLMGYDGHVRSGRYEVSPSIGALRLARHLRNGHQSPVRLTIPNVRTLDRLAAELSKQLMGDSAIWRRALHDSALCRSVGRDTITLACLFIPNTYEVYWNTTPAKLLQRMKRESDAFWTPTRLRQARSAGLTPDQVIVVASIVDQETTNNAEKPMIAGMYLNRYHKGMKLQADPTVKFATRQFNLRRIAGPILFTDSPYNTYKYAGLPPGPICIPSLASIEAVLNYVQHDFLYMCAKEDFSGTHNFARTYAEHQLNAKKYTDALNARGIK